MLMIRIALNFSLFFSFGISWAHAEACEDWFKRLKVDPGSADCEMKCAMGNTDMGSFDCPSKCEYFCSTKKPQKTECKLGQFWKDRLNSKTDPFSRLVLQDLQLVKDALTKMPKLLRPKNLRAIVKASGSVDITSISSPATSSDEYLILFPRGFLNPDQLPRIIFHELLHFMIEHEWKDQFLKFKEASGWSSIQGGGTYRDGNFVDPDGRFSANEDFANNIEFYLFEPKTLKDKSPRIFEWIKAHLGRTLLLEKGCRNAS